MPEHILIIEDEPGLRLTLKDRLLTENYKVSTAGDGQKGLEMGLQNAYDLIILDLMLPKVEGFQVCRELRRRDCQTPVIMLTARGETVDKVTGLKLGADDYLTKPFEMVELLARIEAQLRRNRPVPDNPSEYQIGDVRIDFDQAKVTRNNQPVELSTQEFRLLRYLIENRDTVISREELLEKVWGYEGMPSTRTVDVHIAWLRQKLETNPKHPAYIVTVHKSGYKFCG